MNDTETRTDFLFPKRNFWSGFSSVLNIGGDPDKFNFSKSAQEADSKAIESDWAMIGKDIKTSMSKLTMSDCE